LPESKTHASPEVRRLTHMTASGSSNLEQTSIPPSFHSPPGVTHTVVVPVQSLATVIDSAGSAALAEESKVYGLLHVSSALALPGADFHPAELPLSARGDPHCRGSQPAVDALPFSAGFHGASEKSGLTARITPISALWRTLARVENPRDIFAFRRGGVGRKVSVSFLYGKERARDSTL
jgi:hypothetical protein